MKIGRIFITFLMILTLTSCTNQSYTNNEITTIDNKGYFINNEYLNYLNSSAQDLILSLINEDFKALTTFVVPELDKYYIESDLASFDEARLAFNINLRERSNIDYHLIDYEFNLEIIEIIERSNNQISFWLLEDSKENCKGLPNIDSLWDDKWHLFTLQLTENGWLCLLHIAFEPFVNVLLDEDTEDYDLSMLSNAQTILDDLLNKIDFNSKLQESKELVLKEADHEYNRDRALEYAERYMAEYNPEWYDYSMVGGNCQNYVSQCLLAGGIPFDLEGPDFWKWYSNTIEHNSSQDGRSSSWTGVTQFIEYVQNNEGYGLVAISDAPFNSGEKGDLIHLGTDGNWRHSVIISDVIYDDEGGVADYLVYSNTANLKNYPISLYGYSDFSLTKIIGWNE